jgi:hypothetical protein
MTTAPKESWVSCPVPAVSDTIRWREPLWDKPSKPRGKPDKIGEQLVTAKVVIVGDLMELEVIEAKHRGASEDIKDIPAKLKKGDMIRRKATSIKSGECQKLLEDA